MKELIVTDLMPVEMDTMKTNGMVPLCSKSHVFNIN